MYNNSKQRQWILDFIQNYPGHADAKTIYEGLQAQGMNVSLATVYRNLNILCESHQIFALITDDDRQIYDKSCRPHDHFLCTKCHRLFDVSVPYDRSIETKLSKKLGIRIYQHALMLYGICEDCQKKDEVN